MVEEKSNTASVEGQKNSLVPYFNLPEESIVAFIEASVNRERNKSFLVVFILQSN